METLDLISELYFYNLAIDLLLEIGSQSSDQTVFVLLYTSYCMDKRSRSPPSSIIKKKVFNYGSLPILKYMQKPTYPSSKLHS